MNNTDQSQYFANPAAHAQAQAQAANYYIQNSGMEQRKITRLKYFHNYFSFSSSIWFISKKFSTISTTNECSTSTYI